jgi:hypothetical protein
MKPMSLVGESQHATLVNLSRSLYEAATAGVVGARRWSDLPAAIRAAWLVKAEHEQAGRRRYERRWSGSGVPAWEDLPADVRAVWIRDAVRNPGLAR